jgi:hypothetical protein
VERQRAALVLGVNPITIIRWVHDKSNPRADSLRALLKAFPNYQQQFVELIHMEIPGFFTEGGVLDEPIKEIPSAFYSNILRTYMNNPPSWRPLIRITILQQLLTHLDPSYLGLAASISLCVPPAQGQGVRSVREVLGRANSPWHTHLENRTQFLGVESLPGNAVATGHPVTIQNRSEKALLFPTHEVEWEESALAYPIFSSNHIAGCLYLSSTQAGYFLEERLDIVRSYIDLIALTLEQREFYTPSQIVLGTMPPYRIQLPYLKTLQARVSHYLKDMQNVRLVTRLEAEMVVVKELETLLLEMPYNGDGT